MWGNSTGWICSAIIAVIMGGLLAMVALPPSPTAPTNAKVFVVATKPIALPVAPATVVDPGSKDCDAGTSYRKAMEDYQLAPDIYENFSTHPMGFDIKRLAAVNDILKGRDCRTCTLFQNKPAEVVNYDNSEPSLDALFDAGNICCTIGKLYTNANYDKHLRPEDALKLWQAAFVLGQHLYEERLTWNEMSDGLGLMQSAAVSLKDYYSTIKPDPARADAVQLFMDEEKTYQDKLVEAYRVLSGIDENRVGQYAGDVFAIATARKDSNYADADPMFRVEAIKHVGRYRFNSISRGDELGARKVLSKLVGATGLPAAVKTAADAAHDLTIEKFHAFG